MESELLSDVWEESILGVKIGETYGRWEVVDQGCDSRHVVCKCSCGTIREVRVDHLKDGRSKSCGCSKKENHPWIYKGRPFRKELNHVYGCMIARCYNPKSDSYERYGGRGITVCPEWKSSFDSFAEWAYANGYVKGLTVDRIDNDLGYSPSNCRLATKQEQCHNKRNNVVLMIDGERYTATQAARKAGIKPSQVFGWLYQGVSKDEVIGRLKGLNWQCDEQCAWMDSNGFCKSAACVCYWRECGCENDQHSCEWYRRVNDA